MQILKINNEIIRSEKLYVLQKRYFGLFDNYLDTNKECINYLCEPRIAMIVTESLNHWNNVDYDLISYCIMPNHVHMLIYVQRFVKPLYRIMQSIKRYTSRESNKIINRTGAFWHEESYDHIVRNQTELNNIVNYINRNPVKAGLIKNENDWKWSYKKNM